LKLKFRAKFEVVRSCARAENETPTSVNNRPVKRITLVARLPPAFYIVPHAGWNYGIVTPFL